MAEAVYLVCSCMSVLCAVLLFRGFRATRGRLLFWSGLCFVGLAVNNILLLIDLVMLPEIDLSLVRTLTALVAMGALVFGLVWESR